MFRFFTILLCFILITACDNSEQTGPVSQPETSKEMIAPEQISMPDKVVMEDENHSDIPVPVTAPELSNKNYLFNVSNHSIEELEALLIRAEEVSQSHPADFEDLEIVMVIHGPDIDWFTEKNQQHNRELLELAARLDAYDIIDMKVCEKTMKYRGVDRKEIPPFIESVPYGPAEIEQRLNDGYTNL